MGRNTPSRLTSNSVVVDSGGNTAIAGLHVRVDEIDPGELGPDRAQDRMHRGDLLIAARSGSAGGLDTVPNCRSDHLLEVLAHAKRVVVGLPPIDRGQGGGPGGDRLVFLGTDRANPAGVLRVRADR